MSGHPLPPSEANPDVAIPKAVDAAILRALRKRPAERYASARTFVAALRQAYEGRHPPSTWRKRKALPFALTVTFGALVALWLSLGRCESVGPWSTASFDAGTGADTGAEAGPEAGAGADASVAGDAGTDADAGIASGLDSLSPHEREEAAKDELTRARLALERGDFAEATAALTRASTFDPTNPDIAELQKQVGEAQPDGG
jgi:hypothetical protein